MKKIKPKIYILPGWGHQIKDRYYTKLIKNTSSKYQYEPLPFKTRNPKRSLGEDTSIQNILERLESKIQSPAECDIIFGFSIGALIAYLLATKIKFKKLIVGSISPIIGPDFKIYKKEDLVDFNTKQQMELSKLKYVPLATKNVTVMYGEKEDKILKNRSKKLGNRRGYKLKIVKDGDHLFDEKYMNAVVSEIS